MIGSLDDLVSPRQRLIETLSVDDVEAADVLLGLREWPIGDDLVEPGAPVDNGSGLGPVKCTPEHERPCRLHFVLEHNHSLHERLHALRRHWGAFDLAICLVHGKQVLVHHTLLSSGGASTSRVRPIDEQGPISKDPQRRKSRNSPNVECREESGTLSAVRRPAPAPYHSDSGGLSVHSPLSRLSSTRSRMVIRARPRVMRPWSANSPRILVVVSREVAAKAASCSWVNLICTPRPSGRPDRAAASVTRAPAIRSGTDLKTASLSLCSSSPSRRPRVSEMRAAIRGSPSKRRRTSALVMTHTTTSSRASAKLSCIR